MLLQKNIVKKYMRSLDGQKVREAWHKYQAYFLNEEIQANIHKSKEEQFQEGFLRELFVNVLGYTINPSPGYNLITELKNEVGAKKADGAILLGGKAIGVIELKDHKTRELADIENQAFGYKNKHKDTRIVVVSNFEKLRLYIDNAVDYREWDIFHMGETDFRELYLCLAWPQVRDGVVLQAKRESVSTEEQITNDLYRDYSQFKRELFADILANNPTPFAPPQSSNLNSQPSKLNAQSSNLNAQSSNLNAQSSNQTASWQLLLFKKTQKLLDRFLFIFFAEDCGLLPPNSMVQIIEQWQQLRDLDEYRPLYSRIKKYFGYLDTGHQGRHYEIFAYNGGLFKPDDILDRIAISDDVLERNTRKIAAYDFESDVDVNILGHIFEHSLAEIEEVTQQISNGGRTSTGKARPTSKRKQDGVFYTPQYITKYIVENTVGRLCREKRGELGIVDDDYLSGQRRQTKTKKMLLERLRQYRQWLLQIAILDPACGSGAFLNAALQFLMAEHKRLDEMEARLTGSAIVFPNVENSILEHNLFGVDINEESVGIAQLALWLRTAKPHRKLNSLNGNIKCGNSLISDPAVAGAKAFDWRAQFPEVFAKGGFDVVIGNPPYVRAELLPKADIAYYQAHYKVFNPDGDLFSYFYEKGLGLLNDTGLFGFISNTFDKTTAGRTLRTFIQDNAKIESCVDFTEVQIFEGATTYPVILFLSKRHEPGHTFAYTKIPRLMQGAVDIAAAPVTQVEQDGLKPDGWSFHSVAVAKALKKIATFKTVREQYGKCYYGVKTGLNGAFIIDEATRRRLVGEDAKSAELIKPVCEGKDLRKWLTPPLPKYLICTHNGYEGTPAVDASGYPAIKKYLDGFEPQLSRRSDKGATPYNLRNCAYQPLFYKPKIVWGNLQNANKFSYDDRGTMLSAPACMLPVSNKTLLAVLNSRVVWLFLTSVCVVRNGGYIEVKPQYFDQIPVPPLEGEAAAKLGSLASTMLTLHAKLQELRSRFMRRLTESFATLRPTAALRAFDELEFTELNAELAKQKIRLSLRQQDEWEDYFNGLRRECQALTAKIGVTDDEINLRVCSLYGLDFDEALFPINP